MYKHLPPNEEVSLEEFENVGRQWVALVMIYGPCMDGGGFFTRKMTLSSTSLANTGNPLLDSFSLYQCSCTCCESVSHGLHIVAEC